MATPLPTDARMLDDGHLLVTWSDGAALVYPLDLLRSKCPCAECVDEWTGQVRVRRDQFAGVTLRSLDEVGTYAFRIGFSDGHDLGLFTWKMLRTLGTPSDAPGAGRAD